jgi:hypothetical protein
MLLLLLLQVIRELQAKRRLERDRVVRA